MLIIAGLKNVWDRFSPWGKQENPIHAEFRHGVERSMLEAGIKDARMVGGFFEVNQKFMADLYGMGFRTKGNNSYDFKRAAIFVADLEVAGLNRNLSEGRSIAFMAVQNESGSVELLNVSNIARSHTLDVVNAYTARKSANRFRELLKLSGEQITAEFSGMYCAPEGARHVAAGGKPALQNI